MLKQYFWIISITSAILLVALMFMPTEEKKINFLETQKEKILKEREALTEKEKELEKIATEKEWDNLDNELNEDGTLIIPPPKPTK